MVRLGRGGFIGLAVLFSGSGCGTMSNLAGQEPWLMGPPPERRVEPFGGIDNDIRWMKRGIHPDHCELLPIAAAAIDMPFSVVGDILTFPWTANQCLIVAGPQTKLRLPPSIAADSANDGKRVVNSSE